MLLSNCRFKNDFVSNIADENNGINLFEIYGMIEYSCMKKIKCWSVDQIERNPDV